MDSPFQKVRFEIIASLKFFWRRFVAKNGADMLHEVQLLMSSFGTRITINLMST